MGIETDLNVSPYFDDANNAINDNYHRILFRPSVAVQARELTQMQDILQNQIERFGDHIFVAGTIIKGCNFNFDSNYYYAKIEDLRPLDSQPANPSQYVNLLAHDTTSNLYAICLNYQDGFESQDPDLKTLYFKYINSGINNEQQFSAGATLKFYTDQDPDNANTTNYFTDADVKIASVTNAVGTGYAMSVSSGVVFQKGHFIQVSNNTSTIVSKYSSTPSNVVVGFDISENIITELQDTNLYDSSRGSTNYSAPGAHRLQLIPTLAAYATNAVPTSNFLSLVEWQDGKIVHSFQQTQYSGLGNELARRTFEESGNYFIKPFNLHMENANDTHNYAVTSAGLAYIEGHRVEQLNNIKTPVRKGTNLKTVRNQIINTNYNNSILIKEFIGNFPCNIGATVSIRDTAGTKISSDSFSASITAAGTQIGTAKILSVEYESGTVGTPSAMYRVYLADIRMNTGKNFRAARSLYYSGTPAGFADIVLTPNATTGSNVASLVEPSKSCLIFKTSKTGLDNLTETGDIPEYIYRTVANSLINSTTGNSNIIELTGTSVYPYGQGTLSSVQEQQVVVIPTSFSSGANNANVTLSFTGTVVTQSGNVNIRANTATSFTSQYQVGDYINAANEIRRIVNISNSSYLTVDLAYTNSNVAATHAKTYPVNVPINFTDRNSYMTITDSLSQQLQLSLMSASNTAETLSANMNISVYTNVLIPNNSDRNLQSNNNIVVRLNLANNTGKSTGPWCLGIPYGYSIKNVYRSSNTGTLSANVRSGNLYMVTASTTGHANGVALYGYGISNGVTANVVNSTALLMSAAATANVTQGQFTYGYYSNSDVDDITEAFRLIDGQKDAFFDQSFLATDPSYKNIGLSPSDLLTVVFNAFKPVNTGKGYISIDSYDTIIHTTGEIGYENIPNYTSTAGNYYELRDSIDFRPFVSNTAAYVTGLSTSTINPAYTSNLPNSENYIVAPNQIFMYSARYYIGRIDKLMINSYGAYSVIEGRPSERPAIPADKPDTMTLAVIDVPPYPSLPYTTLTTNTALNYVVSANTTKQNKVYTMKDIAKIDQRVDNLEYYTSLSLLEMKTSSLVIASDVTGANRFKNGIFVDNFTTTDSLDVTNKEFRASLSSSETALVPRVAPMSIALYYANGSNTAEYGSHVTLLKSGDLVPALSQKYASDAKQCTDTAYNYVGKVRLSPSYSDIPDLHIPDKPVIKTPTDQKYTTGQLNVLITDENYATVFDGYTGTGKIPAGLINIPRMGVQAAAVRMNSYFGTSFKTWKPFLAGSRASEFTMKQTGFFIAPETGSYVFSISHDDNFSLTVNDTTWSDPDWDYNTPYTTTSISLTAGEYYFFSFSVKANTKGNTCALITFTVNTNTYSQYPTAVQKPITASMFARGNEPAVPGNTSVVINNVDLSPYLGLVNNYLNIIYTENLKTVQNTSISAPASIKTTPVQVNPPIKDASMYSAAGGGGGGADRGAIGLGTGAVKER